MGAPHPATGPERGFLRERRRREPLARELNAPPTPARTSRSSSSGSPASGEVRSKPPLRRS